MNSITNVSYKYIRNRIYAGVKSNSQIVSYKLNNGSFPSFCIGDNQGTVLE